MTRRLRMWALFIYLFNIYFCYLKLSLNNSINVLIKFIYHFQSSIDNRLCNIIQSSTQKKIGSKGMSEIWNKQPSSPCKHFIFVKFTSQKQCTNENFLRSLQFILSTKHNFDVMHPCTLLCALPS